MDKIKMLVRNRVRCMVCGTTLESKYRHHFVTCNCHNETFCDGGTAYQRVGAKDLDLVENLAEHIEVTKEEKEEMQRKAQEAYNLAMLEKQKSGKVVYFNGRWIDKALFDLLFGGVPEMVYEPAKEDVMKLREQTGCALMECKKALRLSSGSFIDAVSLLQSWGRSKT